MTINGTHCLYGKWYSNHLLNRRSPILQINSILHTVETLETLDFFQSLPYQIVRGLCQDLGKKRFELAADVASNLVGVQRRIADLTNMSEVAHQQPQANH
jgi:hypothetical protein